MENFKVVGRFWNDKSLEIISNGNKFYLLSGWNGQFWLDCIEVLDKKGFDIVENSNCRFEPIYSTELNQNDTYDIIDYKIF